MEHAFISYCTKNQIAADTVRKALEENGIKTWMAPYDIPAGEKYASVINQAIRACACFILLLSNDSQNSVWVARELERAVNFRKTIIPVQLEDVVLNDEFQLYISINHAIPCYKLNENSDSMRRLIASASACMSVKPQKSQPVKEEPEEPVMRKIQEGENYYYGVFSEDSITGTGELVWKNGMKFVGEFVNGKLNGKGKTYDKNALIYDGEYKDGKYHGKGTEYSKGKIHYKGEFLDGRYHGKGTEYNYLNRKTRYVGEFLNGKRTGEGKYYYLGSLAYEGEFLDEKYHGNGTAYYADKSYFIGTFENGERARGILYNEMGEIVMKIPSEQIKKPSERKMPEKKKASTKPELPKRKIPHKKNYYYGAFPEDCITGEGEYILANGDKYVGAFVDGKFHGFGIYHFANGDKYVGDWLNDVRTGKGEYRWTDGKKYVGSFVKGVLTGEGEMTYPNGDRYIGEWKKGVRHGQGKYIWINGHYSIGTYKNDQPVHSILYDEKGRILSKK